MDLLLAHGASLNVRTRIDDHTTALEEAENLAREQSVLFRRKIADKT